MNYNKAVSLYTFLSYEKAKKRIRTQFHIALQNMCFYKELNFSVKKYCNKNWHLICIKTPEYRMYCFLNLTFI